jgi:TolB-like protein/Tfp pilus assembly protein PilF
MSRQSFFAELKRRNVYRAAVFYAASAWLLVQVATQVFPFFDVPNWTVRWIVIAVVIGFPFALLFSWFYEWTPQGIVRESKVATDASITRQTGKKLDRWIIAVLALAVVLLLTNQFVLHKDVNEVTAALASAPAPDQSIAVLPLSNESGDKDQQYFSDGLSENLIVALSQFSGLKVIGRNSAFQFRDSKDDSKTIGAKLGVATLLEGSVQHAGDAVRISAELIRAADGSTLWTQRYDRSYKDLFALQDEITQAVAAALKAKLLTNDAAAAQTDRPPSGNLDAYSAYLQGKFYFARSSEADWRKALEQYATATRIDPRYALAWAASAHAAGWLAGVYLGGAEAQRVNARARADLDTALKLEPNLAAAHEVHGELLMALDFDWSGAELEFHRALQLEPNNSDALENLGVLRAAHGQPEQAIELVRQSLLTDPLRPGGYLLLSRFFASLGRLDEAEQAIRKAIALQPASGVFDAGLVEIEIQRGDAVAALATAERTLPGLWQDYALAMARQIGNDHTAADAALKLVIDKYAEGMAFQIAEVYALRKDPDNVFRWLDRAWTNRDTGLEFLLVNPFILRHRDDPRFATFCSKIGLPATTTAKALP